MFSGAAPLGERRVLKRRIGRPTLVPPFGVLHDPRVAGVDTRLLADGIKPALFLCFGEKVIFNPSHAVSLGSNFFTAASDGMGATQL